MRVCEVTEFGGPEVLRVGERRWPRPSEGQVVVRIEAFDVNPSDLAARSGAARRRVPELQPPFIPGWDLAGVVDAVGGEGTGYAPGDRVVGLIPFLRIGGRSGSYAQAAAVDPEWIAPRPDTVDAIAGSTIPLNALTARQLLDLIDAPRGATVLITGASGAVGTFATQLAVHDGLRVIAQASHDDADWVASLGAGEVLERDADLSQIGPVDALLDAVPIGADSAAALRDGGVAAFTRRVEVPDAAGRGIRIETPLVRNDAAALAELTRAVAEGRLQPPRIARTLDLDQTAEAHRLAEQGGRRGKIVVRTA